MKRKLTTKDTNTKSVLVIDDEKNICDFFVDLFNEYGIHVEVALNGRAGLEKALKNTYSLIFLDVKLGDVNGLDVLKKIKETDKSKKVIMISGYLKEPVIEQALKYGANGYLPKPISVRDVISMAFRFVR